LQIGDDDDDDNNDRSDCEEEMKIRLLDHVVNVAPFDNVTFTQATRCVVIAELPSGVSSQCVSAKQGYTPNEVIITIERSKHLFDPTFYANHIMKTGNPHLDDGSRSAATEHCKKETMGKEKAKSGVIRQDYKILIPAHLIVETGFREHADLTSVNNKSFIRFRSVDMVDKHENVDTCNLIHMSLLAWTTEQKEAKQSLNLLSRGQSRRGGEKIILSLDVAYGDYDNSGGTPPANQVVQQQESPSRRLKRGRDNRGGRSLGPPAEDEQNEGVDEEASPASGNSAMIDDDEDPVAVRRGPAQGMI
jgi:hypothetical protein